MAREPAIQQQLRNRRGHATFSVREHAEETLGMTRELETCYRPRQRSAARRRRRLGAGHEEGRGAGARPAAQQNAPAEKIAPAMNGAQPASRKLPETTGQAPKPSAVEIAGRRAGQVWTRARWTRARRARLPAPSERAAEVRNRVGTVGEPRRAKRHHRSGRGGRLRQAVDRAAHQDHDHHPASTRRAPVHLNVSVSVGTRDPGTACISIRCRWK